MHKRANLSTGRFKRGKIILLLWFSLILATSAQPFGRGPDGRPLGQLGKAVEARFLFPAGQSLNSRFLFPLVLECQNLSREPQYLIIDWYPKNLRMPPEYKTVLLEPGAKKRLPMAFSGDVMSELSVRVNQQNVPLTSRHSGTSRDIGILSNESDRFDYLRSLKIDGNVYYTPNASGSGGVDSDEYLVPSSMSALPADLFPSNWGYLKSLQVLICYDLNAVNLSDAQLKAMENWVRQGGQLVLVSNGIANEYTGSKLEHLLPLYPESTETVAGRVVVQGRLHKEAKAVPEGSEDYTLCWRPVDYGRVWFVNTPLLDTTTLGEQKTVELWRGILNAIQPNNGQQTLRVVNYDLLNNIPEIPRTQAGWVALFILMYGVVVGPINLSVLRKRDKMLYAFITVPLVALLFAGGAYAVNRFLRPSKPVLREVGWFRLKTGELEGPAEAEQVLFSPNSRLFDLSCQAGTAFSPTLYTYRNQTRDPYPFTTTPEDGIRTQLPMGTWDIQRLNALSVLKVESGFELKVDRKANQILVNSPLESDGESAVIQLPGEGTTKLFHLKKGENTISFDLLLITNTPATQFSAFSNDLYPSRSDLTNRVLPLLDSSDSGRAVKQTPRLIFWTQEVYIPMQVDGGTAHRHDCLVTVEAKQ